MRLRLLTGIVLGLLLLRAYIPVGFMPASGAGFALMICPDGLATAPAVMASAHVHHPGMVMPDGGLPHGGPPHGGPQHGGHGAFDHCPFGSLPGTGPVSASMGIVPATATVPIAISRAALPLLLAHARDRAHPPRGPPSPA